MINQNKNKLNLKTNLMEHSIYSTQSYKLEDGDVCEVNLKLGYVTFKDKNFNTKSLRMDRDVLISSIIEALSELQSLKDYETSDQKYNLSILECFKEKIELFIKTSEENQAKWGK